MEEIRKYALWLTAFVLACILLSTFMLTIQINKMELPPAPVLSPDGNDTLQDAKTKEIKNYKELVSVIHSTRTNIFEQTVVKIIIPIFNTLIASVLGFIFANECLKIYRERRNSSPDC